MLSLEVLLMGSSSRLRGLSHVAVFLLNHLSRGYQDVYMLPQNCTSIEDWVGKQQILSTVASLGDADMQRNT